MSEAKKPAKGKPVRQIIGAYVKDDNSSSSRHLLTAEALTTPATFMALDVSGKTPAEVAAITEAFKGYQLAFAEHARQFPTMADWFKQRGMVVDVKSFKVAGFKDPHVAEV